MLGSGINRPMLEATRTVDRSLETESADLAERRERWREKFAATLFLRHDQLPIGELDPLSPSES